MILDEHMPIWDVCERHSVQIGAPPDRALAAALDVTSRELPIMRLLMGIRTFPAVLVRRSQAGLDAPLLRRFERMGFGALGRSDDEVAYGGVGRFWQPAGGLRRVAPQDFAGFGEPGYAKAGFNFLVEPDGH